MAKFDGELSTGFWDAITAIEAVGQHTPHQHRSNGFYAVLGED
jgi:hypothetical protein